MNFDAGEPGILFIGDSPMLSALRRELVQRGFRIAESPEANVLMAVADEDVLDGLCTPQQGRWLAATRALGLECLPVAECRERLLDPARGVPTPRRAGIAQQA